MGLKAQIRTITLAAILAFLAHCQQLPDGGSLFDKITKESEYEEFTLQLEVESLSLYPGGASTSFKIIKKLTDGSGVNVTSEATLQSDNPAIAEITTSGRLYPIALGTSRLTASYKDQESNSVVFSVVAEDFTLIANTERSNLEWLVDTSQLLVYQRTVTGTLTDVTSEVTYNQAAVNGNASSPLTVSANGLVSTNRDFVGAVQVTASYQGKTSNIMQLTVSDTIAPTISSIKTKDNNQNGLLDALEITFSEPLKDSSLAANIGGVTIGNQGGVSMVTGSDNDEKVQLTFPEQAGLTGDSLPALALPVVAGGAFIDTHSRPYSGSLDLTSTDGAPPLLQAVRGFENNRSLILQFDTAVFAGAAKSCSNPAPQLSYQGGRSLSSYEKGCGSPSLYWQLDAPLADANASDTLSLAGGLVDQAGNPAVVTSNKPLSYTQAVSTPALRKVRPNASQFYNAALSAGDKAGYQLLVAKGSNQSHYYNPVTDAVEPGPDLPAATHASNSQLAALPNGDVLLVHAGDTDTVSLYKAASNSWQAASSLPGPVTSGYLQQGSNNPSFISQHQIFQWNNTHWTGNLSETKFTARSNHQVVVFNNKLYLLGGDDGSSKNDVWKSINGLHWTEVTSSAPWSAGHGHKVVVFNNELYLLGGFDSGTGWGIVTNDVWKSADGQNWTQVTSSAQWSARIDHQVVVFNNEMYLLGGYANGRKNDVWKSTDGQNWTQVTSNAPWSARDGHKVVVFNNELYLLGGIDGSVLNADSLLNDVWKSTDGQNWTQVTSSAPWKGRFEHQVTVLNDELYLLGGRSFRTEWMSTLPLYKSDVWKSADGLNWTRVSYSSPWSARYEHQVVVFNNELYLLGGRDDSALRLNDVWKSPIGLPWQLAEIDATQTWGVILGDQLYQPNVDFDGQLKATHTQTYAITTPQTLPAAATTTSRLWHHSGGYYYAPGESQALYQLSSDFATSSTLPNLPVVPNEHTVLFAVEQGIHAGRWLLWHQGARYAGTPNGGNWQLLDQVPVLTAGTSDSSQSLPGQLSKPVDASGNRLLLSGGQARLWDGQALLAASQAGEFGPGSQLVEAGSSWLITQAKTSNDQDTTVTGSYLLQNGSFVAGPALPYGAAGSFALPLGDSRYLLHSGTNDHGGSYPSYIGVSETATWNSATNTLTSDLAFNFRDASQLLLPGSQPWYLGGNGARPYNSAIQTFTGHINWSARYGHQVVVFNNELYLMGGNSGNEQTNDVWKSTDGLNWTKVTEYAPWSGRSDHQVLVFNNELYLLDGFHYKNDVWKSTDGQDWTQVTSSAPWSARFAHQVVVFNNEFYLLGGYSGGYKNDVWKSADGLNWTRVTSSAPWSARYEHQVVVFNNELYLIGGGSNNDVWKSVDGLNWTQVTSSAPWGQRREHQVVVFNNELYLLGGYSRQNDIWKSADGLNWTQVTSSAQWRGREEHQVVAFNNELYLLGGYRSSSNIFNDVWKSTDGQNWTKLGPLDPTALPCTLNTGAHHTTLQGGQHAGKNLVFCGGGTATILHDPATQTFSAGPTLATAIGNQAQSLWLTASAKAGQLLVVPGAGYKTLQLYDPATHSFTAIESAAENFQDGVLALEVTKGPNAGQVILYQGGGTEEALLYQP